MAKLCVEQCWSHEVKISKISRKNWLFDMQALNWTSELQWEFLKSKFKYWRIFCQKVSFPKIRWQKLWEVKIVLITWKIWNFQYFRFFIRIIDICSNNVRVFACAFKCLQDWLPYVLATVFSASTFAVISRIANACGRLWLFYNIILYSSHQELNWQ